MLAAKCAAAAAAAAAAAGQQHFGVHIIAHCAWTPQPEMASGNLDKTPVIEQRTCIYTNKRISSNEAATAAAAALPSP